MTDPLLLVDPGRMPEETVNPEDVELTGIVVRAGYHGHWLNVDIALLDRESLLRWLRSKHRLAERTVLVLLGYDQ